MQAQNFFESAAAAANYRDGRPDFHAATIDRIRAELRLDAKLERALDIACGTGLSTRALLRIARHVAGTDTSAEMLRAAGGHPDIQYQLAPAERQPFADGGFDLITVCSGVHWFNIEAFLRESRRLLVKRGWLVLYDNFFLAEIPDAQEFNRWHTDVYQRHFPPPPRNDAFAWTASVLSSFGFENRAESSFENTVRFDRDSLIRYFISQSNIINAVESGRTSYDAAKAWIHPELSAFFPESAGELDFRFGNWIKYLQAAGT